MKTIITNNTTNKLAECIKHALAGKYGTPPSDKQIVSGASLMVQFSKHVERQTVYRNNFICIRCGVHVGACYVEKKLVTTLDMSRYIGLPLRWLMEHDLLPIRVVGLDAYLGDIYPHHNYIATPVSIPPGTSVQKSVIRANSVIDMMDLQPGEKVALIGVVNSLINAIRKKQATCLPCDFNGIITEKGDAVARNMWDVIPQADKILATGMTLGNGTFEPLLDYANRHHKPLTVFAQTGSAVFPQFMGKAFLNLSAEPFPFFWIHGNENTIYQYRYPFNI